MGTAMIRSAIYALVALAFVALTGTAEAASCFWIGGAGLWSTTNTASWASATGGTTGTCAATGGVPKQAADTAIFDASSGGGVVTVDSTLNGSTLSTITMGAFTGTLDFSVNNPSMTLGGNGVTAFDITGAGTRTLKLGSGTFTCKSTGNICFSVATITGLTFTGGSATINLVDNGSAGTLQFANNVLGFGGNTLVFSPSIKGITFQLIQSDSFLTITANANSIVRINSGKTVTTTNAVTWVGTAANPISLVSDNFASGSVTAAFAVGASSTFAYTSIGSIAFTGAPTASNSFNMGNNSGITINGPTAGGGGRIIGG